MAVRRSRRFGFDRTPAFRQQRSTPGFENLEPRRPLAADLSTTTGDTTASGVAPSSETLLPSANGASIYVAAAEQQSLSLTMNTVTVMSPAPPPGHRQTAIPLPPRPPQHPAGIAAGTLMLMTDSASVSGNATSALVEISADITSDTTFRAGTIYVITAEVHVRVGVTLTIEDGVEVRIRNGSLAFPNHWLNLSTQALIFDSGSSLRAQTVSFFACDDTNEPVPIANNGGIFFCGATRAASKDNVSSQVLRLTTSSFIADRIVVNFLGRRDPKSGDGDGEQKDDIDAISVIGTVWREWNVAAVESNHSGDDGFDLTNSCVALQSLQIYAPTEDGLNLSSSTLWVGALLAIDMTENKTAPDREIFDFEVDNWGSQLLIAPLSQVDLRGFWDTRPNDYRVVLRSRDMPQPTRYARDWYEFHGGLQNGQADIFTNP
jgi:hypothetical protein